MPFNNRILLTCLTLSSVIISSLGQNLTCFGGGQAGNCSSFVGDFCNSLIDDVVEPLDTVSRCYGVDNSESVFKCDFTAWSVNSGSDDSTPSIENCITLLSAVTSVCPMGGEGIVSGGIFLFIADPNVGACGPPCGS